MTFSWQVNPSGLAYAFDAYANPLSVTRSSSLGYSRTDATTYHHNTAKWVIGQVATSTNSNTGFVESQTIYDSNSALPSSTYVFGKIRQTFTYNLTPGPQAGTLATVKDGNNKVTTLSNWKRGIPQTIQFPGTPDQPSGAIKSAGVDDHGRVTSVTDENGYSTGYGYDSMGRLAAIAYPVGDSVGWTPTTRTFAASTAGKYGLLAGHWQQIVSTGSARAITYYDGLWRPVVVETFDAGNESTTRSLTVTRYDADGHAVFQSYPMRTLADYTLPTQGVHSTFDALDRIKTVSQNSELGLLTTTTDYLTGFQTRTTNPRNKINTTSYMAYDQPSADWPVSITHPADTYTDIVRNTFGHPLSVTRRNAAATVSSARRYVYDGYRQLCKTIEPETGATVMQYDGAGNVAWSAAGLTLPDTANCNTSEANASGRRADRIYDGRNRLTTLTFPDGNGNQEWKYWPDSAPSQLTTWNVPAVGAAAKRIVSTYVYNRRRLLTTESVALEGWWTFNVGYGYDANGSLASHNYPSGQTVGYAPNALGQPTQAGSYATNVSYHPNGGIAAFTYGNGILHTMTPNARQLPASSIDSGGVLNHQYSYDANANVSAISDIARGATYSRAMSYDDLDRLETATSPMFGGTDGVHRFTYDAVDNLKSWKLAGVKDYANYYYEPGTHRLTEIQNTAGAGIVGIGYDVQGNVANKSGHLYAFDFGNRLRESSKTNAVERYRYDAHGRRVLASRVAGPADTLGAIFSHYASSGQLMYQRNERPGVSKDIDHIYLGGSLVAQRETSVGGGAATVKYQHTDALGSPVAVTSSTGALLERMEYEPYGKVIGGAPAKDGPGYTGHVLDAATGMNYMQQRYYDPTIGRFLSVDPVAANTTTGWNFNRYNYAANNPYRFKDPDGRVIVYANDDAKKLADETRKKSKVTDALLKKLDGSKNTWKIGFKTLRANSKPSSQSNTTYSDDAKVNPLSHGKPNSGSGGEIIVNRDREFVKIQMPGRAEPTRTAIKPGEVLTHELGHAVEADTGILPADYHVREINGNARKVEDAYRVEQGLPGYRTGVFP